jgi:hypothetical protein
MRIGGTSLALFLGLITSAGSVSAQQSADRADSARAQIQGRLRAFYFNLAHRDWEALTADVLAAKMVAHRRVPDALLALADSPGERPLTHGGGSSSGTSDAMACSASGPVRVDRTMITLDGEWAEASVPRCFPSLSGVDEFRLIHFQDRWRFVYIDLFQEPVNVSVHR